MEQDMGVASDEARAATASQRSPQAVSGIAGIANAGALETAISLAAEAHRGQVDKAGQPYILHPLRVMLKLDSEPKRIAAVLHDVVEDCGISLGMIDIRFGEEIAEAVDALSRREGEGYDAFIERCGANDIARAVKWADLCDNMDMSRLPSVNARDMERYRKYDRARGRLWEMALAAQGTSPREG